MLKRFKKMKFNEVEITILIADPDQMVTVTLANILSESYRIIVATAESDILPLFKKNQPQIVLINHNMQTKLGLDILADLKKVTPDLIGIVLTGHKDITSVLDGINEELVYYYIYKPINIENLKNIVHRAVLQCLAELNQKNLLQTITRQNEELNKQNLVLAEMNQTKANFIRNFAHRFATPLTAILTAAEFIYDQHDFGDESMKETHFIIYQNAMTLTKIIYNLTAFGKIGTSDFSLNKQKILLSELITSISRCLKILSKVQQNSFVIVSETAFKSLNCDKSVYKLFFCNLISYLLNQTVLVEWTINLTDHCLESVILAPQLFLDVEQRQKIENYMTLAINLRPDVDVSDDEMGIVVSSFLVHQLNAKLDFVSTSESGTQFLIQLPIQ